MRYTPMHILLVEDNAAEAELINVILKDNGIPYRLSIAATAHEALDFAFRRGEHGSEPRPDIIMLDLNLGFDSGHDVLKQLKSDSSTHCIPVIVFTASQADPDVLEAYNSYANCYITKPSEVENFIDVVGKVENFWSRIAVLPDC
jgi:CheY-like chemotaxis protein